MERLHRSLSIGLSCLVLNSFSQSNVPNDFKIGIFGSSFMLQNVSGCDVAYTSPLDQNGNNTSTLNVLSEDGFNIFQTYSPNEWTSMKNLKNIIQLTAAHNMQVELGAGHYYKPTVDQFGNYTGVGTNVFDNCGNSIIDCDMPWSQGFFRATIDDYLYNVYTQSPYKDVIWGYHICEEASYNHFQHFANDCQGNTVGNPLYFKNVEIPVTNVNAAMNYFKNTLSGLGVSNHKMVIMEANHHKSIHAQTNDGEGVFNPQQYLQLLSKTDSRDVFFEGSYTQFPAGWGNTDYGDIQNNGPNNNWHYLGPFKSIDFAKDFVSEVHKVINIEGTSSGTNYMAHYHSDPNIPNASWLWFQTYNSIIHGASGVWFWDLSFAWNSGETNHWGNPNVSNRYARSNFPANYQLYVSNLAKELRLLYNKNVLSTDPYSIVASKTDHSDIHCIVPNASSYLPFNLPPEKRTENYGLRYTIRTNGAETYMIIANPLNVPVTTVLDFSASSNKQIQNAFGVNVLFDNNQVAVNSPIYKVNRNANINLSNGTVGIQHFKVFTGNKQLSLSFGPMDVKVLKFVSVTHNYNNNWSNIWTNNGSGNIGGHVARPGDYFYPGDFDGDGSEELLCVGYNSGGTNDWITLLKYMNGDWYWYWSNNGLQALSGGLYPYRYNFTVGDFDGDGKDELLGNHLGGYTTMFKFNNGTWQWMWSDYGSSSHAIRPYKDKFYCGDYNGDGKDELLGVDSPNGWMTEFLWSGTDFIWGWSDYGNHAMRPYRFGLHVGDFDNDGKDEILGFSSWATLFDFNNGDWHWIWSNNGQSNINGWAYPLAPTDRLVIGNIDTDNKEELFFIQADPNAGWATTMDLKNDMTGWNWNWSANTAYSVPYIDDWSLAAPGAGSTRYYLIRVNSNDPECLLAMRDYCGKTEIAMFSSNNKVNFKVSIDPDEVNYVKISADPEFPDEELLMPGFKSSWVLQKLDAQAGIIEWEATDICWDTDAGISNPFPGIDEIDYPFAPGGVVTCASNPHAKLAFNTTYRITRTCVADGIGPIVTEQVFDTGDPYIARITGEPEQENGSVDEHFSVFPNPANNVIFIEASLETGGLVELFDLTGKQVLTQRLDAGNQKYHLNINELNAGVYILTLSSGSMLKRQRLIIL